VRRAVYKPLGLLFLGLASLGVVLPGLPTTPFLILAAWFFARSSEKWHQRLLQSELFGPLLRNWEQRRCMSLQAKLVALGSMLVAGGASVTFAIQDPLVRLIVVGLMAVGSLTVLSIRTCGECSGDISHASARNLAGDLERDEHP
jgi:uncharacterized membrane protein YbaN (DUF454 family)